MPSLGGFEASGPPSQVGRQVGGLGDIAPGANVAIRRSLRMVSRPPCNGTQSETENTGLIAPVRCIYSIDRQPLLGARKEAPASPTGPDTISTMHNPGFQLFCQYPDLLQAIRFRASSRLAWWPLRHLWLDAVKRCLELITSTPIRFP